MKNAWLFCIVLISVTMIHILMSLLMPGETSLLRERVSHSSEPLPLSVKVSKRGYAMCSGNEETMLAGVRFSIDTIRNKYKSRLPIMIAHCAELTPPSVAFLHSGVHDIFFKDICDGVPVQQRDRLRGWFCKPAALVASPFNETMLVDADLVWLQNPDFLFDAPLFQKTGALFFRDRLLYESDTGSTALKYADVVSFIQRHRESISGTISNSSSTELATRFASLSGGSYYWLHALNSSHNPALGHMQESSVVLLDSSRLPRTVHVLHRILWDFHLGYGDKEIFWVAATIAGEPHSFEPFLAGLYGDCGAVFHYDPRSPSSTSQPFFINSQYLVEFKRWKSEDELRAVLQPLITNPVLVTESFRPFHLGAYHQPTGGRCGGCELMGCSPANSSVNEAIEEAQRYQLSRARMSWSPRMMWSRLVWTLKMGRLT